MVEFDAEFAGRYFAAVTAHAPVGKPTRRRGRVAFETRYGHKPLIVLQYLMTAMNAHIDLDLAVVTEEIIVSRTASPCETSTTTSSPSTQVLAPCGSPVSSKTIEKISPVFSINSENC